jgi:hypothetical protein
MNSHISILSASNSLLTYLLLTSLDSLNLLYLDQASCHTATTLVWTENVLPIFQPTPSPKLNHSKRFWSDIKKHFKGRNFDNLPSLTEQVFSLINSLCPSTIVSLTGWSYIFDALNDIYTNST